MIERVCQYCGKTFMARPNAVKRGEGKYCSNRCARLGTPKRPLAERFWEKVDMSGGPDACWPWLAGTFNGYGIFAISHRKSITAHRMAYILTHGSVPDELFVCHNCPGGDNPSCVNPNHMFLGTTKENAIDMVKKGRDSAHIHPERQAKGEAIGSSKLTEQDVRAIRKAISSGQTQREIARRYGIGKSTVGAISRLESWRHI